MAPIGVIDERLRGEVSDGYFPEGSILRRVHSERAVGLFYGQRALMIGALNPLAFVGTTEHTNAKLKPFQRLSHTAEVFETIFFGTRAEADRALAFVHRLHERVRGEMPEDAGKVPAGTPYSAFDPELMLWTLAVIADSGPFFYELFVDRLDENERERLWQEYVRFGELFGMPREVAPPSHREFREWFEGMLGSLPARRPRALRGRLQPSPAAGIPGRRPGPARRSAAHAPLDSRGLQHRPLPDGRPHRAPPAAPRRAHAAGRRLVLSSPRSSPARRSLPPRRPSTSSVRTKSATWRPRRGSPCR